MARRQTDSHSVSIYAFFMSSSYSSRPSHSGKVSSNGEPGCIWRYSSQEQDRQGKAISPALNRCGWNVIFQVRSKSKREQQQRTGTWNPETLKRLYSILTSQVWVPSGCHRRGCSAPLDRKTCRWANRAPESIRLKWP